MYEFLCDFPKPQRPAPNGRLSLAEPSFSSNKIVLYKVHLLTSTLGPQHRQQQLQQQGMLQILDANFEEPSEDCGPLTSTSHLRLIIGRRLVGFPFNCYRRANVVYRPRVCALAIKLASLGAPLAIGQGASGSGAAKTVAGTPCFTSPGSRFLMRHRVSKAGFGPPVTLLATSLSCALRCRLRTALHRLCASCS